MDDLAALAERYGIETGYHDVFGGWHPLPETTLNKLVQAIADPRNTPVQVLQEGKTHQRAFQGDGHRHWALAVQLYAVRSRRNWGHGDFTDLKTLVRLAARHGAAAVGLNPLHALFPDRPEHASPYGPNTRLFLNPFYIDVEALPEFPTTADLDADIATARAGELVDYTHVARAKLKGLRIAFDRFCAEGSTERRADFEAFRNEQGEALLCFACFEALRMLHALKPWPQWPEPWRRPDTAALHCFREQHRDACAFQEFMQWNADRQLRDCQAQARELGMLIGLYIDVAVGIDPHGADAWAQQDAVLAGVSVGAPPDEFNPAGQDWGLAPINPGTIAHNDFARMRRLMRAAMRHAGAIRLDHVLGLNRIFMIPHGMTPGEGAYVCYPFEQVLGVIAQESNDARCVVIGEDLGTVPEGFRETLSHYGLWSYRVMMFERDQQGRFRPQESYPAEAVATFNTHDLPTYHGWLTGHDLRVKHSIGFDPGETDDSRHWAQQKLREALQERVPDFAPDDFAAVAAFLGAAPSLLVCVAIEDILGVLDQVNIPGTVEQHPNWRRKLPVALEDMEENEELRRVTEAFAQTGRATAR
ncbi:MAG TPA: 4-alpha-glucanotransferase [Pseudolabrys sp.]|jgi:4-alpha-glucanotransferase